MRYLSVLILSVVLALSGCSSGGARVSKGADLSTYRYVVISDVDIKEVAAFSELEFQDAFNEVGIKDVTVGEAQAKEPGSTFLVRYQIKELYSQAGVAYHNVATVNFKDFHTGKTVLVSIGKCGSDLFDLSWSPEIAIQRAIRNALDAISGQKHN